MLLVFQTEFFDLEKTIFCSQKERSSFFPGITDFTIGEPNFISSHQILCVVETNYLL